MNNTTLINEAKRIIALADLGILYKQNDYDDERYHELKEIGLNILHNATGVNLESLKASYPTLTDYATPKVDVRGILLNDENKILMVKESADNKWSIPGGWADIGYNPKESIIKEFKEETGLEVSVTHLLAVMDKKDYPHPFQPLYIYKLIFRCQASSHDLNKGFDICDVKFFDINNLPELSEDRILKNQIELLYNKIMNRDFITFFD